MPITAFPINTKTATKADVGLGSVDNTSDANKPVSAAQAAAIAAAESASVARANHTGTQASSTISDFTEAAQDAAAALLTGGTHAGIAFTYNDASNRIDATVGTVYDPPTDDPNNLPVVITQTDNAVASTSVIARVFTAGTYHYNVNRNAAALVVSISAWGPGASGLVGGY